MRNINRPVADASGITKIVPVEQGGFGSTNADEAAANIAAASSSMLGLPNGLARLDEDGKVPLENFPSPTMFAPTLKGPTKVNPGERVVYEITNWEPGKTYTVSATAGSVSVAGNQVAFIAPKDFGIVGLSVGDRTVNVEITAILTNRPEIYVTDNPESAIVSVRLSNYDGDTRLSLDFSQFELRKGDEVKQFIVRDGDKISTTLTDLNNDTTYYIKGRHVTEEGVVSEWSREVSFRTAKEFKETLRQILKTQFTDRRLIFRASDTEIVVREDSVFTKIDLVDDVWRVTKVFTLPMPPGSSWDTHVRQYVDFCPSTRCFIVAHRISTTSSNITVLSIDSWNYNTFTESVPGTSTWSSTEIAVSCAESSPYFIFARPGMDAHLGYAIVYKYDPVTLTITQVQKIRPTISDTEETNWYAYGTTISGDGRTVFFRNRAGKAKTTYVYRRADETLQYSLYGTIVKDTYGVIFENSFSNEEGTIIGNALSTYDDSVDLSFIRFEIFRITYNDTEKTMTWLSLGVTPPISELRNRYMGDGLQVLYPSAEGSQTKTITVDRETGEIFTEVTGENRANILIMGNYTVKQYPKDHTALYFYR